MKSLMNILSMGVLCLLLFSSNTEACTYNPVAVIRINGELVANGQSTIGYSGEVLQFDGSDSYAIDPPYLYSYRWEYREVGTSAWQYIGSGGSPTQSMTINLPVGVISKDYQVRLRVQDVAGKYGYSTITMTIKRQKARYYYVKDHLGSIRTTVDIAGNVIGYDDYYPFGLSMPGRSSNSANSNDDYKFTGHEFDNEASLNLYYAGARYLDPVIGRWSSIDPLAAKYPSLSPYNYVINNPVNAFDPDGRDVWFVHGTFSSRNTWSSKDGKIRYDDMWASALNDRNAGRFNWSWDSNMNTARSRRRAASRLAEQIKVAHDKNPEMLVQLVAHSHGGNVSIEVANILYEKYGIVVDRLILLGTPSRSDFTLDEGAVKEGGLYNIADYNDWVQIAGGVDSPFGNLLSSKMWPAKRSRPKDERAVEVRVISERGKVESHTKLHTSEEIIKWIEEQLYREKQ